MVGAVFSSGAQHGAVGSRADDESARRAAGPQKLTFGTGCWEAVGAPTLEVLKARLEGLEPKGP